MGTINSAPPYTPKRHNYVKYYKVAKNQTALTEVSTNDFTLTHFQKIAKAVYTIGPDVKLFDLYIDIGQAMEKAKSGALAYISELISEGEASEQKLLQYRMDHYEDLHVNLVDSNIQAVEDDTTTDKQFKWHPYRINN
jgi:hypothetical protein